MTRKTHGWEGDTACCIYIITESPVLEGMINNSPFVNDYFCSKTVSFIEYCNNSQLSVVIHFVA